MRTCLPSIFKKPQGIDFEMFIIDNASSDGTSLLVKTEYPQVNLVCNRQKKGFASNNNQAIRQASGRYILLLNPDTIVQDGCLAEMVRFMDEHKDAGAAGCKLLNPDNTLQYNCRRFPTPKAIFLRWATNFHDHQHPLLRDYLMMDWDHERAREVDWFLGAFLMVRREIIDRVGMLDQRFDPLYYEDVDWCYRIRLAGYKIYYNPQAVVIHRYHRESARNLFNIMTWYHIRNIIRFFLKHRKTKRWKS